MSNDFTARDDAVTVVPLNKTNNPVPAGASLASDNGPLLAKAPEVTEQPVVVNYALTGNGGRVPRRWFSITSKTGYNNRRGWSTRSPRCRGVSARPSARRRLGHRRLG